MISSLLLGGVIEEVMKETTDIYHLAPWSLAVLFPSHDGPEMPAAFAEVDQLAAGFETRRASLSADISPEVFKELVHEMEAITRASRRISAYAGLWFAADTQNQAALNLVARVDQFMAS